MLSGLFKRLTGAATSKASSSAQTQPIDDTFAPKLGRYFRSLDYPSTDADGQVNGVMWMEASLNPASGTWTVWRKQISTAEDLLDSTVKTSLISTPLQQNISFVKAFDSVMTFESALKASGTQPLDTKTPGRLGADYLRHFAWREGLMMAKSGRLYPTDAGLAAADNQFDMQDIEAAKAFLQREREIQFVEVPVTYPQKSWPRDYEAVKAVTDARLNVVTGRYAHPFALTKHIVANETAEVLYAHLKRGFEARSLHDMATAHWDVLEAALNRDDTDILHLLAQDGLSFDVTRDNQTIINRAITDKRYGHLHVMLAHGGVRLANYAPTGTDSPAVTAIKQGDGQAFQRLYEEGIDFTQHDAQGWYLVHHAFAKGFTRGLYAWIDENLPIDMKVEGTDFTGLSLAQAHNQTAAVEWAIARGANALVPAFTQAAKATPQVVPEPAITVSPAAPVILPTANTQVEIEKRSLEDATTWAAAFVAAGGSLNWVNHRGESLFEALWKTPKYRPLLPVLHRLGADSAAFLPNGTTALTKHAAGPAIDLDYVRAILPLTANPNQADVNGNTILHALQLNPNDQIGRAANIEAVIAAQPALSPNIQNKDGYSPAGLAIRLNKPLTYKVLETLAPIDLTLVTAKGWSLLDIAYSDVLRDAPVVGAPRALRIEELSDELCAAIDKTLERATRDKAKKADIANSLNRIRPDDCTLLTAMLQADSAKDPILLILKAGANPDQPDAKGDTPRQMAVQLRRTDIIPHMGSEGPRGGDNVITLKP